jgi:DNA topoisomerase-6 subunit A
MARPAPRPRTLFSTEYSRNLTPAGLRTLRSGGGFVDGELEIFRSLVRNERTVDPDDLCAAAGPLVLLSDGDEVDYSRQGKGLTAIPRDVTGLELLRCRARGILFIETGVIALRLAEMELWKRFRLLLVSSRGLPHPQARSLLRRLQDQFRLPIYLLTDNDTWGYFIFSVLKRGALAPGATDPKLALKDVRFLGVRAGDFAELGEENRLLRWEALWDSRLAAMGRYPCFRSRSWKDEFRRFREQKGKAEIAALRLWHDRRQASDYLNRKLKGGEWLT